MRRRGGTFGIPAGLAVVSIVALIVGLLGDGAVDIVAWIGLSVPVAAIAVALFRMPFRGPRRKWSTSGPSRMSDAAKAGRRDTTGVRARP